MGKDTPQALDNEVTTLTNWVEKVGEQYMRSGSLQPCLEDRIRRERHRRTGPPGHV